MPALISKYYKFRKLKQNYKGLISIVAYQIYPDCDWAIFGFFACLLCSYFKKLCQLQAKTFCILHSKYSCSDQYFLQSWCRLSQVEVWDLLSLYLIWEETRGLIESFDRQGAPVLILNRRQLDLWLRWTIRKCLLHLIVAKRLLHRLKMSWISYSIPLTTYTGVKTVCKCIVFLQLLQLCMLLHLVRAAELILVLIYFQHGDTLRIGAVVVRRIYCIYWWTLLNR